MVPATSLGQTNTHRPQSSFVRTHREKRWILSLGYTFSEAALMVYIELVI